jgi:hypothetical protein
MSTATGAEEELELTHEDVIPESGIHPTARCFEGGDDLRAALLRLCESETPKRRVWSIAPVLRRMR